MPLQRRRAKTKPSQIARGRSSKARANFDLSKRRIWDAEEVVQCGAEDRGVEAGAGWSYCGGGEPGCKITDGFDLGS